MVSCKEYVEIKKEELKEKIKTFERPPKLCVIQVGEDPASNSYIKGKSKDCTEVGIEFNHVKLPEDILQGQLEYQVQLQCNLDNDGVIVQLPLPKHIDVNRITKLIPPEKDVDGFGADSCFKPCTPKGIVDWLKHNNYNLTGKDVVVLGRSKIVGKPLINMLIDEGATVTCCNSKTLDLSHYTIYAELVISAVGKPKEFGFEYFSTGLTEIIVDVGINRDENGKLCGDIDNIYFDKYLPNTYVTPVPGGVGLLTRTALVQNTVEAYELNNGGCN